MKENTKSYDDVTLPMIFEEFSEIGKDLTWCIIYLTGVADLEGWPFIPQLDNYIVGESDEYILDWDTLCKFVERFDYFTDLKLFGCKYQKSILDFIRSNRTIDVASFADIAININEGALIELCVKDEKILERVTKRFGSLPFWVYLPDPDGTPVRQDMSEFE